MFHVKHVTTDAGLIDTGLSSPSRAGLRSRVRDHITHSLPETLGTDSQVHFARCRGRCQYPLNSPQAPHPCGSRSPHHSLLAPTPWMPKVRCVAPITMFHVKHLAAVADVVGACIRSTLPHTPPSMWECATASFTHQADAVDAVRKRQRVGSSDVSRGTGRLHRG